MLLHYTVYCPPLHLVMHDLERGRLLHNAVLGAAVRARMNFAALCLCAEREVWQMQGNKVHCSPEHDSTGQSSTAHCHTLWKFAKALSSGSVRGVGRKSGGVGSADDVVLRCTALCYTVHNTTRT
jgi:hypothetical protein